MGPGSLLGGRYVVARLLSRHPRCERWAASDQTLDRAVVLLCFDADGPQASAALDAARRAAGVEEPRLVRVLDVGRDAGIAFVVEEPLTDAHPLDAALRDGGLPAEEGRRIVGEAASALETARVRGLHHQVLTPRSVLLLEDGSVKVRGLATEAALAEAEESDSDAASRTDAVALVALAYAVLTGRWPLAGPAWGSDSGLEAAPRVVGGVAAPSEVAAGVPADLDLIARHTLNHDKGPISPGDLAAQIAPWSGTPHSGAGGARLRPGSRTEPLDRDPSTGGVARGATVSAGAASAGAGAVTAGAVSAVSRGAASADSFTSAPADLAASVVHSGAAGRGATVLGLGVGAAVGAVGAAGSAAGSAAATMGARVGGLARTAADRTAERSADRAERRQTEHLDDDLFEGHDMRLSETLEETDEAIEPPVPMMPGGAGEPLDRDQSRFALLVVLAFVVVAAVLGVWGLPKLGGSPASSTAPLATATVTATPPSAAVPPAPSPATPSPATPTGQPVGIVDARQYDPDNGGVQTSRTAALAYDGDPATMWRSSKWYGSPAFGGFQKAGLGLVLDLGQPTDVHRVAFTLRGASDVTVYVANQASIDGATEVGKVSGQDGDVSVTVPNAGAAKGTLVILWFTRLAPDGEGHFRAQVAETSVS